jgi:hypothetical protein
MMMEETAWEAYERMRRQHEEQQVKHETAMLELELQAAHDRLMLDIEIAKITARTTAMLEIFEMELQIQKETR